MPTSVSKDLPLPVQAPLSWRQRLGSWLYHFLPSPLGINGRERLRVTVGIGLGILLAALLARWWSHDGTGPQPWMVASLGASAVLVFATPSSPLSQPWPVLAGSTLSVLVGLACALLVPYPAVAAALAVALSVAIMVPLRCLHPPGAAVALFAVLSHEHGVQLAALPIFVNAFILLLFGVAYNTLTGRISAQACCSAAVPGTDSAGADMMSLQRSSPSVRWKAARPARCSRPSRSARLMSSTPL